MTKINSGSDCKTILSFIKHIFGNQYEMGLDYFQLLLFDCSQNLPIINIVANYPAGKTTFIKLLKSIFNDQACIITKDNLLSNYNDSYIDKLIIAVDEYHSDKIIRERILMLHTADSVILNRKNKEPVITKFQGKFILSSNDSKATNCNRFWNLNPQNLKYDNVHLLTIMKDEIPEFKIFLSERKLSTSQNSRVYFDYSLFNNLSQ
jgi:hypothetical protein